MPSRCRPVFFQLLLVFLPTIQIASEMIRAFMTSDTPNGVQFELASGKVKSIRLNNGTQLSQWPQTADLQKAIATNDPLEVLYKKIDCT
ncbi:hypothetical protein L0657_05010 [Dyadobacter sp. CY345]|nr:hypothetical protein [Dyadobacter sp. CY345]